MAGSYPDAPGHRMAWDRDGSVGFIVQPDGTVDQLTTTQMQELNDEDMAGGVATDSTGGTWTSYYGVLFAQAQDLDGVLVQGLDSGDYDIDNIQTSTDTTTGADGTWTTQIASPTVVASGSSDLAEYRTAINALSASGVVGLRFRARKILGAVAGSQVVTAFHIFGSPTSSSERLRFWHPTLDQEVDGAYFDWGDVPRSTIYEREFRIKNPLAVTANDVLVSIEALTDTAPSNVAQHSFSTDNGTTFDTTATIGTLAPGGVSSVVILRRDTLASAATSLWWVRMIADAASYS